MRRDYVKWYSPSLHREMELLAFGDRGFPVVVFPTSGGRFYEYEDRGMIHPLAGKIDRGELQVFCVDSVDPESWYNRWASPPGRLNRQNAFDTYLVNEFAPFVANRTSWPQMGATGCSFGGYHAVNFALKRADVEEMHPSPVSAMPEKLTEQLGPERMRDLLTFLRERTKEVLTGSSASIVVRIFGPDLPKLRKVIAGRLEDAERRRGGQG